MKKLLIRLFVNKLFVFSDRTKIITLLIFFNLTVIDCVLAQNTRLSPNYSSDNLILNFTQNNDFKANKTNISETSLLNEIGYSFLLNKSFAFDVSEVNNMSMQNSNSDCFKRNSSNLKIGEVKLKWLIENEGGKRWDNIVKSKSLVFGRTNFSHNYFADSGAFYNNCLFNRNTQAYISFDFPVDYYGYAYCISHAREVKNPNHAENYANHILRSNSFIGNNNIDANGVSGAAFVHYYQYDSQKGLRIKSNNRTNTKIVILIKYCRAVNYENVKSFDDIITARNNYKLSFSAFFESKILKNNDNKNLFTWTALFNLGNTYTYGGNNVAGLISLSRQRNILKSIFPKHAQGISINGILLSKKNSEMIGRLEAKGINAVSLFPYSERYNSNIDVFYKFNLGKLNIVIDYITNISANAVNKLNVSPLLNLKLFLEI